MTTAVEFWETKHRRMRDRLRGPHDLADQLDKHLAPESTVLELGCGAGHDAIRLAERGHHVVACDFADVALDEFAADAARLGIEQRKLDLSALPYPFDPSAFDAVYARLSLHYFPAATTRDIFTEIARVLRPDGVFLGLFNSAFDAENGTGTRIEDRYFELAAGSRKRYFTAEEGADLLGPAFGDVDSCYVPTQDADATRLVRISAKRRP
jgi:SAM-dependent methyltransferase